MEIKYTAYWNGGGCQRKSTNGKIKDIYPSMESFSRAVEQQDRKSFKSLNGFSVYRIEITIER